MKKKEELGLRLRETKSCERKRAGNTEKQNYLSSPFPLEGKGWSLSRTVFVREDGLGRIFLYILNEMNG
jgi:hypothetical protein